MTGDSRRRIYFRAGLMASGCGIFAPGTALAQTVVPQTPASNVQTSEQQSAGVAKPAETLNDIVITAQRRRERLQDVPLSVTAINGKELRDKDIRDVTRLEQVVPGLRIGRSGNAARPAIRGVYTEAIQATSDPRIGFYIDEIYQSRLQQTTAAFVDLERVEVQKGPQGTLFGRNSLGGNIALTSALPTARLSAGGAVTVGNYDRVRLEGFFNTPIAEGLTFRAAGAFDRHGAYYKSTVTPRADVGDYNSKFVRGTLRYAPASMSNLEVILRGSYFNEDDRGIGSFNAKNVGAIIDPSLIRAPGGSVTFNGITYPFPAGYNGGNYATGVLVPFSPVFRDGIPDINGADVGIPIGGKYNVLFDFQHPLNKVKAKNASAVINLGLTDNVRVRSITGYTDFNYQNRADGDGGPIPFREFFFLTTAKTLTQEFQLQSANAASPLQYTAGVFYMNDKIGEASGSVYSNSNYMTTTAAANNLPVLYGDGGVCGYTLLPRVPNCNLNNTISADNASPIRAQTKSKAVYAQASYTIDRRLTLTAGARYTVDDKDYRQGAQSNAAGTLFVGQYVTAQNAAAAAAGQPLPFPLGATGYRALLPFSTDRLKADFKCGAFTPATFAANGTNTVAGTVPNYFFTRCGSRKFKFWTYRLAADYKITPDNMIYVSYSTGVHSGGFGASFAPTTSPQGVFATFDAEKAHAFEIGTKNSFFDKRLQLNAAIFYNKYLNNQVQGTQFVLTGANVGTNIATIANVGNTSAPGAEVSFLARVTRGLTVRGAVNYLHARNSVAPLGIFGSGLCSISTGSGPCVTNPVQSGAGLGSGFFPNPFTNPELFVALKNSAGTITGYNSIFFGKKTRVQNTPDWSGTLGASYEIPLSGDATLTPEADLLWSGKYLLSASAPNVEQKAYSKVDARITYRTGPWSAQLFVLNLTNKATLGRVTTGTLSAQGTYSDPRTYGFRVGYNF